MSKVEEIKAQIDALTWQERCELNALLQNWPDDDWDRQMASEGKFDRLMEEAGSELPRGAMPRVAASLKSIATSGFWKRYHDLPEVAQQLADRGYAVWSRDPRHPSLRFKPFKNNQWSARIGSHEDYNKL